MKPQAVIWRTGPPPPEAIAAFVALHGITKCEPGASGLPPKPPPGRPEIARARRDADDDGANAPDDPNDRDKTVLAYQPLISKLADKWRAIGRTGGAAAAPIYRPPEGGKWRAEARAAGSTDAPIYRSAPDDVPAKRGRKVKIPRKTPEQEEAGRVHYWLRVGDDYTQGAWETALRCWPAWDPSRGSFGAFARQHIGRALQHYAEWDRSLVRRMSDDRGRDVALDAPAPSADDCGPDDVGADPGTWGDRIALDPDGIGYDAASGDAPNHEEDIALGRIDIDMRRDRVLAALQRQPTADQIAVRRRMGGASFAEIGRALGVAEDGARRRVERATERLRHNMEKDLETRLSGSPAAHVIYTMRGEYPSHSNVSQV